MPPKTTTLTRIELLEEAILEYIEKYGATEKARMAFHPSAGKDKHDTEKSDAALKSKS